MRFPTSKGWNDSTVLAAVPLDTEHKELSTVIAVLKLDGMYAVQGVDYHLYSDGSYEEDSIETGVNLKEGIVLHTVPSGHFYEPSSVYKAVIRDNKVVSDRPVTDK